MRSARCAVAIFATEGGLAHSTRNVSCPVLDGANGRSPQERSRLHTKMENAILSIDTEPMQAGDFIISTD
jgi:hypothetical protein